VQAYEYVRAEQAQQECQASHAADAAQRDEVAASVASSEKEDAELKKKLSETLAKKEKEVCRRGTSGSRRPQRRARIEIVPR
jgi:hypothetical protein